jgi:hypothetical protein
MPRRNRNAHALTIDADALAAQVGQLSLELATTVPIGSALGYQESDPLYRYLAEWFTRHPGRQVVAVDAKQIAAEGW